MNIDEFQKMVAKRAAHVWPSTQTWSNSDHMMAIVGEIGELANLLKKLEHIKAGDYYGSDIQGEEGAICRIESEIADVITYALQFAAKISDKPISKILQTKYDQVNERFESNANNAVFSWIEENVDGDLLLQAIAMLNYAIDLGLTLYIEETYELNGGFTTAVQHPKHSDKELLDLFFYKDGTPSPHLLWGDKEYDGVEMCKEALKEWAEQI